MEKDNDKNIWVPIPDWLKKVEDKDVFAAIGTLLFDWNYAGKDKIDNLEAYVKENFEDLSDDQVKEVCNLLIEHKVVK